MSVFWQAIYVKPRTEKKVTERLSRDYEVFCPIKKERKKWSDRVKIVETPLLSGYVFFKGDERTRLEILEDPQVVRSVFWNGKPAKIYDHEIEALRQLLEGYESFEMVPLKAGESVKIISGAFENQEAQFIKISGNTARVELRTLGVAIVAVVDKGNVKRI